jgi:hypothetical protein
MSEAADTGVRATAELYGGNLSPIAQTQEFAVWFLFGSVFALVIYFIWAEIILKKVKKK